MERVLGNKVNFADLVIYLLSILTCCQFTNEPNREISRGVFQNRRGGHSVSFSPLPFPLPFFLLPPQLSHYNSTGNANATQAITWQLDSVTHSLLVNSHLAAMSPHTNGTRHLSQWFIREKLKGGKGWVKGTIQGLNKASSCFESIVLSTWSWC